VSFYTQSSNFVLHFREAGLESRLEILLGG
jgi:hypothetical protein